MATYLFALFAWTLPLALSPLREEGHGKFILIIFSITFAMPALAMGIFRSMGTIDSVLMHTRRERIVPFLFITALYGTLTYMFYTRTGIRFDDNLFRFMLIIDALIVVGTLLTLFWKVSMHSLAAWGFTGIMLALNRLTEDGSLFYPLIFSLVIAGLVMSARLQLQAHSMREVTAGAIAGLLTSFAGMVFLF
jgi:membrane-associated phospholipid phosphatase